jgi:hypothetical protein
MARLLSARNLVLGGLAIAAYAAAKNKRAVSGLLGGAGDSGSPQPYTPAGPAPAPAVSNVDVSGPPENTATHVPAPDPLVHEPTGGIDEQAEEQAAAAEAANIGGTPSEYPSEEDPLVPADEALRPLEEAGEGYAEGQELAEADLIDNAEPAAGDPIEGERAILDAIEEQDEPFSGERLEGSPAGATEPVPTEVMDAPPPSGPPAADVPPPANAPSAAAGETPADEKSTAVWRIDDQPTVDAEAVDNEPEDAA